MIKPSKSLKDAKRYVNGLQGKNLQVLVNLGRNKTMYYQGKLTGIYPALFTISPFGEFRGKTSFSYSELLCGGVKIRAEKDA